MREERAVAHPHSGPLEDPAQAAKVRAAQYWPHVRPASPRPPVGRVRGGSALTCLLGCFPIPTTSSLTLQTLTVCPTIQFNPDAKCLELVSESTDLGVQLYFRF